MTRKKHGWTGPKSNRLYQVVTKALSTGALGFEPFDDPDSAGSFCDKMKTLGFAAWIEKNPEVT